jgi:hypothetical protein
MHDIDKKLIKKTNKKLVISGNKGELYIYEKPVFYNYPGASIEGDGQSNPEERRLFSIKRSRDKIRRLCNANCYYYSNYRPKFLTLTFRDDVTDLKTARYAYRLFNQKLQYRYPKTKYLGVAEIQKKRFEKYGVKVWHFHVIYFNLPFIYGIKSDFEDLWPHGFIKINAIDHVLNVGAYVSKYLRKDLYEKELVGEKSFFVSRGLQQPNLIRSQQNVEKSIKNLNYDVDYEEIFESPTHGKVRYQVLTINK